jgi:hypothetical protein
MWIEMRRGRDSGLSIKSEDISSSKLIALGYWTLLLPVCYWEGLGRWLWEVKLALDHRRGR